PPFPIEAGDVDYEINKQRALEPFLGEWVPVPFFAVKQETDANGDPILESSPSGPVDWCRVRVTQERPAAATAARSRPGEEVDAPYNVVFAFDTELVERRPNRPYAGPSSEDVRKEQNFALIHRFRQLAFFLRDEWHDPATQATEDRQQWVVLWIEELFPSGFRGPGGRLPREDEAYPLEPLARYVAFVQLLNEAVGAPRVAMTDTHTHRARRPVKVSLLLDIGNSR